MKRWSSLQTALYRVIDPEVGFQIHSNAYKWGSRGSTTLPRLWVTIGKQIIWDFPKDFVDEPNWYFEEAAPRLSCLIRDYIDCPVDELLTREFRERFKLIPILRVCDRRIGKRRLEQLLHDDAYSSLYWLIERRLNKSTD